MTRSTLRGGVPGEWKPPIATVLVYCTPLPVDIWVISAVLDTRTGVKPRYPLIFLRNPPFPLMWGPKFGKDGAKTGLKWFFVRSRQKKSPVYSCAPRLSPRRVLLFPGPHQDLPGFPRWFFPHRVTETGRFSGRWNKCTSLLYFHELAGKAESGRKCRNLVFSDVEPPTIVRWPGSYRIVHVSA